MIGAFFKGLGIQGYIIGALVTLFLLLSVGLWIQTKRVEGLKEDIATAELQVQIADDALVSKDKALDTLEGELRECATKRANAEERAARKDRETAQELREAFAEHQDFIYELSKELDQNSVNCGTLSSRATELLIEATRRANRDTNRP